MMMTPTVRAPAIPTGRPRRVPSLFVLVLRLTAQERSDQRSYDAVSGFMAQKPAAEAAGHGAHEAALAFLWVVRVYGVTGVAVGVVGVAGGWWGLLAIWLLTSVLRLLAAILTTRLLRLVIPMLETPVLRCAVCALLLVIRLAVGRCGRSPVALVLLRIPAVTGLLLVVRIRLRLAIRRCASVATLLLCGG